jgi:hypothetical protein
MKESGRGGSRGNRGHRGSGRGGGNRGNGNGSRENVKQQKKKRGGDKKKKQPETVVNHTFSSAEEDDDAELCLICCERLVYVAIGSCNHTSICANCVIRQRVLYKNRSCSLCKADVSNFVVTSDRTKWSWEDWSDHIFGESCGGRLVSHNECDGFFDTQDRSFQRQSNNFWVTVVEYVIMTVQVL